MLKALTSGVCIQRSCREQNTHACFMLQKPQSQTQILVTLAIKNVYRSAPPPFLHYLTLNIFFLSGSKGFLMQSAPLEWLGEAAPAAPALGSSGWIRRRCCTTAGKTWRICFGNGSCAGAAVNVEVEQLTSVVKKNKKEMRGTNLRNKKSKVIQNICTNKNNAF